MSFYEQDFFEDFNIVHQMLNQYESYKDHLLQERKAKLRLKINQEDKKKKQQKSQKTKQSNSKSSEKQCIDQVKPQLKIIYENFKEENQFTIVSFINLFIQAVRQNNDSVSKTQALKYVQKSFGQTQCVLSFQRYLLLINKLIKHKRKFNLDQLTRVI